MGDMLRIMGRMAHPTLSMAKRLTLAFGRMGNAAHAARQEAWDA